LLLYPLFVATSRLQCLNATHEPPTFKEPDQFRLCLNSMSRKAPNPTSSRQLAEGRVISEQSEKIKGQEPHVQSTTVCISALTYPRPDLRSTCISFDRLALLLPYRNQCWCGQAALRSSATTFNTSASRSSDALTLIFPSDEIFIMDDHMSIYRSLPTCS
jgi:hypothetical protein